MKEGLASANSFFQLIVKFSLYRMVGASLFGPPKAAWGIIMAGIVFGRRNWLK